MAGWIARRSSSEILADSARDTSSQAISSSYRRAAVKHRAKPRYRCRLRPTQPVPGRGHDECLNIRHLLVTDRRHHPRYAEIRNYPTTPPQDADLHRAPKPSSACPTRSDRSHCRHKRQRRCRRRALAGTAGWRTRRHCRPKWSDGNTRGCALDIGSVPNKSMLAPDHLGPLRSTRSNRTCLRLFLLSNRMRLIDVSSVKPSSCGRSAGQRSQYGATIRPVVSAGRTPV